MNLPWSWSRTTTTYWTSRQVLRYVLSFSEDVTFAYGVVIMWLLIHLFVGVRSGLSHERPQLVSRSAMLRYTSCNVVRRTPGMLPPGYMISSSQDIIRRGVVSAENRPKRMLLLSTTANERHFRRSAPDESYYSLKQRRHFFRHCYTEVNWYAIQAYRSQR